MEQKLLLIDGNSILNRAFYGLPDMTNSQGLHTNAVLGFLNIMFKFLEEENPTHLAVAFDLKAPTFRHKMFADYKGTRKGMPDELREQVPVIREVLQAMNIPLMMKEGYEADDLLGTMSVLGEEAGFEVKIVSGDRDLLQLATKKVQIRIPKTNRAGTVVEDYYEDDVLEKYQVTPKEFIDVKALMGDASDNIPGIPGIGEKTALKLLNQYGTIENLKEHMDELKGKMGEKVRTNIELGLLSKKIATIITDAPVELDLDAWKYEGQEYNDDLAEFYRRYDMNSLLKRMSLSTETKQSKPLEYKIVETLPNIKKNTALIVGVYDTNYHKSAILGFGLYNKDEAYYISLENAMHDENFKSFLKDEKIEKYGYDIKKCIYKKINI